MTAIAYYQVSIHDHILKSLVSQSVPQIPSDSSSLYAKSPSTPEIPICNSGGWPAPHFYSFRSIRPNKNRWSFRLVVSWLATVIVKVLWRIVNSQPFSLQLNHHHPPKKTSRARVPVPYIIHANLCIQLFPAHCILNPSLSARTSLFSSLFKTVNVAGKEYGFKFACAWLWV
jgi:hypothetical protein